jgi:hypothetical protein
VRFARQKTFETPISDYFYFGESDVVLMHTIDKKVWRTQNQGFKWDQIKVGDDLDVLRIVKHPYSPKPVSFKPSISVQHAMHGSKLTPVCRTRRTSSRKRGFIIRLTRPYDDLPIPPNDLHLPMLDFHPDNEDWLIFTGSRGCEDFMDTNCHAEASICILPVRSARHAIVNCATHCRDALRV